MRNQSTRQFVISTLMWLLMLSVCGSVSANDAILQCDYQPTVNQPKEAYIVWQRDPKKYISPFQVHKSMNDGRSKFFLSDVRSTKSFKKYHIKQSLNFPHNSLKTKTMFFEKNIVLIGNGKDYQQMEHEYDELVKVGFKHVKILDGGVQFWKSKIDHKAQYMADIRLNQLSTIFNNGVADWQVIDATSNAMLKDIVSNVIQPSEIAAFYSPSSFKNSIKTENQMIPNVLLVLPVDSDQVLLTQLWQKDLMANVFVIDDDQLTINVSQIKRKQKKLSYKTRTDGAKLSCT